MSGQIHLNVLNCIFYLMFYVSMSYKKWRNNFGHRFNWLWSRTCAPNVPTLACGINPLDSVGMPWINQSDLIINTYSSLIGRGQFQVFFPFSGTNVKISHFTQKRVKIPGSDHQLLKPFSGSFVKISHLSQNSGLND